MKKTIAFLLLAVALAFPVLFAAAFSADAAELPVIAVDTLWSSSGSVATVKVTITKNPGILGATLTLSWDEGLTLLSAENGEAFAGATYQAPSRFNSSGTNFMWYGSDVEEILDGTVLTLTFRVSDTIDELTALAVNISGSGIYDADGNAVNARFVGGCVQIVNYLPGDVSGNRVIDTLDLIMLARYISDGNRTDPEGYNVTIHENAADVNDDGNRDALDLILISRYISDGSTTDPNGYNIILLPVSPPCTHSAMETHPAKDATCTAPGNTAYWYCPDCGKYFADQEASVEINGADAVIPALSHPTLTFVPAKDPTTEPGNIAYWYCDTCGCCFSDEACQNEITYDDTLIPIVYHKIIYQNTMGAEIPAEQKQFAEHLGVLESDLPKPEVEGYTFAGWLAVNANGEPVTVIMPGTTEDVYLWAKWELVDYTITYRAVWGTETTRTYTVEDSFEIPTPQWRGLDFSHWEDTSGKLTAYEDGTGIPRVKLEKGTTGDIELIARWKAPENRIVPKTKNQLSAGGFDEKSGAYWFIFELGSVKKVVLQEGIVPKTHSGTTFTLSTSKTVTISEEYAQSMSRSVAESLTTSTDWTDTKEWSESITAGTSATVTTGVESSVGKEDVASVTAKVELEVSASLEASTQRGLQTQTGGSEEIGDETVTELGTTFSYNEQMSTTEETSYTLTADDPNGKYRFVHTGEITVFALVTYDPATQTYAVDLFNRLGDTTTSLLYTPDEEVIPEEDYVNGTLTYTMDKELIKSMVESAYYVKYDGTTADGGKPMEMSVHPVGASQKLNPCTFTKTGYSLSGWWTMEDLSGTMYLPDTGYANLAQPGETITLYAQWTPNNYSITYEPNGGILPENSPMSYTVEDAQINLPTPSYSSYPEYNHFLGWYEDPGLTVPYTDDYKTNPRNLTLYAKWDLCTVYNTIDSTPRSTSAAGRLIIDWRNEIDTNMLNHENRIVDDGRYNNIDITSKTKEVIFIGKEDMTFTNLCLHLCTFSEGQKLTVRFVNFNFVSNESTAIGLYEDNGVDLTIDVTGKSSITTSYASGSILGLPDEIIRTLTFTGDGDLTLKGGNGAGGSTSGAAGGNGGVAVYAQSIIGNMSGTLDVWGGNGGNGAAGAAGTSYAGKTAGTGSKGSNGGDGGAGGAGGNGASAIVTTDIQINSGTVTCHSGNGGNGGYGGNGGVGQNGGHGSNGSGIMLAANGGDGGAGGKGGAGGNGGAKGTAAPAVVASNDLSAEPITMTNGTDGITGNGGNGGNGGRGGNGGNANGSIGDAGQAGNGGAGGNGGSGCYGGNGGNGGRGGNKGKTKYNSRYYATGGKGGKAGTGEIANGTDGTAGSNGGDYGS